MAAERRVAVTDELLEEIQDWSEITGRKQHEVLTWLIEQAKLHLTQSRPEAMEAYKLRQQVKAYENMKVAI